MSKNMKAVQASQAQFLRWNLTMAEREFGVSFNVIKKGLANAGAVPNSEGFFSTAQIVGAICGDRKKEEAALMAARKRKLEAQAKTAEMDQAQREGTLVSSQEFLARLTPACAAIRSKILGSSLPQGESEALLDAVGQLLCDAMMKPSADWQDDAPLVPVPTPAEASPK